jgi:UDP-N-acetylmuramoylalanine--D-glutamate ligase
VLLEGKCVVVVGLGFSGVAAAQLCRARGARVIGTDCKPAAELSEAARGLDAELVTGGHAQVAFGRADLVVVSPGVPPFPELVRAEQAGVEVIGELELAWRYCPHPVCCVGGTNGKSTTTVLLSHLLEAAGIKAFVGGNLGTPVTDAVGQAWDLWLVEVSSFQLERAPSFRPHVSVLLNVSSDHLDRYPSQAAYARAKGQAFVNQTPDDYAVVPAGDAVCAEQAARGRARAVTFGEGGDYRVESRAIVEQSTGTRFGLQQADLHGRHNLLNAAAAIGAARALGVSVPAVEAGARRFRALPHRLAGAGEVGGVHFYDDSKATNVGAAVTALCGLAEARGVLIAGGRDKLGSYAALVAALERKGRAVVVIGEAAQRLTEAVGGRLPVQHASGMEDAVRRAYQLARPGDAVLLSPACSSFDMFASYADRGEQFVAAVQLLRREAAEVRQ